MPALALVVVWWRRADPVDIASATGLAFLTVTAGFGMQYMTWPLPFLMARPMRWTWPLVVIGGAFAATAYLYLGNLAPVAYDEARRLFAYGSVPVVVLPAMAMPWSSRTGHALPPVGAR